MTFKELLKERDFSAAQIARRLKLTSSAVSGWVRGISSPSYTHLVEISKILDVSIKELVRCFAKGA